VSVDQVVANFGTQYWMFDNLFYVGVRRSGCCQLRHLHLFYLIFRISGVSVDQVVANFGTLMNENAMASERKCPSIRLLPTSAPESQQQTAAKASVSVDQVVANFGTGRLHLNARRVKCVRRSGCCQLRHRTGAGLSLYLSHVSVDQVVANFGTEQTLCWHLLAQLVSVDQVVANFGTIYDQTLVTL